MPVTNKPANHTDLVCPILSASSELLICDSDYEKYKNNTEWVCNLCINENINSSEQKCSECLQDVNINDSQIRCAGNCKKVYHLNCSGYKRLLGSAGSDRKWECNYCFELPKCRVCDKSFKRRDKRILCSGECKRYYHISCLDVPIEDFEKQWKDNESSWVCFPCTQSVNKSNGTSNGMDELTKLKRDNESLKQELKSVNEVLVCLSTELVEQRRLVKEAEVEVLNLSEAILIKEEELLELHEIVKGIVPIEEAGKLPITNTSQIPILRNDFKCSSSTNQNIMKNNDRKGKHHDKRQQKDTDNNNKDRPGISHRQSRKHRHNTSHSKRNLPYNNSDLYSNNGEFFVKMPSEAVVLHVESSNDPCVSLSFKI
ncbi:uncharacterized protein LOC142324628 [Lycorma delicatula]|uniref:uncharacterized protein LOC142324628 n=1 Tax=Lycorma delicatula TaxID=130591 RepID=UPI003F50F570